jgi:hypothetical protein
MKANDKIKAMDPGQYRDALRLVKNYLPGDQIFTTVEISAITKRAGRFYSLYQHTRNPIYADAFWILVETASSLRRNVDN